jgi:adenylosuccinate lyase
MASIWSPQFKFTTWRRLWIALATAEKELGLDITDEQLEQMKSTVNNINYDVAGFYPIISLCISI